MSRIFFVALLVVCFVYVLQATPVPDKDEQPPNVVDTVATFMNQSIHDLIEKTDKFLRSDDVTKAGEAVRQMAHNIQEKINEGVATIIPKTEGSEAGKQ